MPTPLSPRPPSSSALHPEPTTPGGARDSAAAAPLLHLPTHWQPCALPQTASFALTSRQGDPYRVLVAWPEGEPPAGGWPWAVVLGEENFLLSVALLRHHAGTRLRPATEPGVLVAIGYPGASRRGYDYTPGLPEMAAANAVARPAAPARAAGTAANEGARTAIGASAGQPRGGGADAFLDFLEQELQPAVAAALPVNPGRRALVGHSLGGLCVLHALFTRPGSYACYVAASPSVWWGNGYLSRAVETYLGQATATAPASVLLTAAEYEQTLGPDDDALDPDEKQRVARQRQERAMVDGCRALAQRLATATWLQVESDVIAGEGHASTVPRALDLGLRRAFARHRPDHKNHNSSD